MDAIKKELNTPNLKDALYILYQSYKEKMSLEIIGQDDSDYEYILEAKKQDKMEKNSTLLMKC